MNNCEERSIEIEHRYRLNQKTRDALKMELEKRFGPSSKINYANILFDTENFDLRQKERVLRIRVYDPEMARFKALIGFEQSRQRDALIELLKSARVEVTLKVSLSLDTGKRRGARQEITDMHEIGNILGLSLSSQSSVADLICALAQNGINVVGGVHTKRIEFMRSEESGASMETGPTVLTLDASSCLHDDNVRSILEAERMIEVPVHISKNQLNDLVKRAADNNKNWVKKRLMRKEGAWPIVPGTATCCLWRHLKVDKLRVLVACKHLNPKHLDILRRSGDLSQAEISRLLAGQVISETHAEQLLAIRV